MYETCLDCFVRNRPLEDLRVLLRRLATTYPKCFFEDPEDRKPLAENVIDQLCLREGLGLETVQSVIKYYHHPWQFRLQFQGGLVRVDLDGAVAGRLSPDDALAIRDYAQKQRREAKEKTDRIKNSGANIPVTFLPKVKIPEKPATSILSGIKQLKAELHTNVRELEDKITDIFPHELIEIFPDLEKQISKLMEACEAIVTICAPKTNGKSHDEEARV